MKSRVSSITPSAPCQPPLLICQGVHGVPFRAWDGVTGKNWAAYCPHGSVLFPTWHRPYMALYEVRSLGATLRITLTDATQQVIWLNAQWIAAKYPASQRARYRAAALTLRIPYWDWSVNPTMPPEVNQPTIYIKAPNGTINVPNPLFTYTFHPLPSNDDFPPIGSPVRRTSISPRKVFVIGFAADGTHCSA